MPVQYVNRPDHNFRGYAGTIAAGRVRPGDVVINAAAHTEAAVSRIVSMDGDRAEAGAGDPVMLVLDREIDISRGDVLAADPGPVAADGMESWIVWMDDTPLFRGRAYLLMLGTRTVVATVTDITTRLDMETLEEISVRELHLNEIGRVTISLTHPVVCEPYRDEPRTGRLYPDRPADSWHRRGGDGHRDDCAQRRHRMAPAGCGSRRRGRG